MILNCSLCIDGSVYTMVEEDNDARRGRICGGYCRFCGRAVAAGTINCMDDMVETLVSAPWMRLRRRSSAFHRWVGGDARQRSMDEIAETLVSVP